MKYRSTHGKSGLAVAVLTAILISWGSAAPATVIGQWLFNEGSGSIAEDTSGNSSDGAIAGASYIPSFAGNGYALSFAAGDEVVIPDPVGAPDHLNINGNPASYSISTWLRIDDFSTFGLEPGIGKVNFNYGIAFYTGGARVNAYTGSGGNRVRSDGGGGPELFVTGVWQHLVATFDTAVIGPPNYFLYLDGAEVDSRITTHDPLAADGTPFTIGRNFGNLGVGASFAGFIDEVILYDNALTPTEVAQLYAAGPVLIPEPVTAILVSMGVVVLYGLRRMRIPV